MALGKVGETRKPRGEVGVLARLDEAEMPFGQGQRLIAGNDAEHRHARGLHGFRDQDAMALAADAVEHDAGDAHRVIVRAKPRATAAADCDWPATSRMSSTGRWKRAARSAVAPRRPGGPASPSNRPITPSITSISASRAASQASASRRSGGIAQLSRLTLGAAGRRGMEGGIDVIGARFRRADRNPATRQRGEQRERHRRLAGARARGRDDEAARGHDG